MDLFKRATAWECVAALHAALRPAAHDLQVVTYTGLFDVILIAAQILDTHDTGRGDSPCLVATTALASVRCAVKLGASAFVADVMAADEWSDLQRLALEAVVPCLASNSPGRFQSGLGVVREALTPMRLWTDASKNLFDAVVLPSCLRYVLRELRKPEAEADPDAGRRVLDTLKFLRQAFCYDEGFRDPASALALTEVALTVVHTGLQGRPGARVALALLNFACGTDNPQEVLDAVLGQCAVMPVEAATLVRAMCGYDLASLALKRLCIARPGCGVPLAFDVVAAATEAAWGALAWLCTRQPEGLARGSDVDLDVDDEDGAGTVDVILRVLPVAWFGSIGSSWEAVARVGRLSDALCRCQPSSVVLEVVVLVGKLMLVKSSSFGQVLLYLVPVVVKRFAGDVVVPRTRDGSLHVLRCLFQKAHCVLIQRRRGGWFDLSDFGIPVVEAGLDMLRVLPPRSEERNKDVLFLQSMILFCIQHITVMMFASDGSVRQIGSLMARACAAVERLFESRPHPTNPLYAASLNFVADVTKLLPKFLREPFANRIAQVMPPAPKVPDLDTATVARALAPYLFYPCDLLAGKLLVGLPLEQLQAAPDPDDPIALVAVQLAADALSDRAGTLDARWSPLRQWWCGAVMAAAGARSRAPAPPAPARNKRNRRAACE